MIPDWVGWVVLYLLLAVPSAVMVGRFLKGGDGNNGEG